MAGRTLRDSAPTQSHLSHWVTAFEGNHFTGSPNTSKVNTMPLWASYEEKALDLSRPVEEDRVSLVSGIERHAYPYLPHNVCDFLSQNSDHEHPTQNCVPQIYPGVNWDSRTTLSPLQSPVLYDMEFLSTDVEYQTFEREAMSAMAERNGGNLLGSNPRMRRLVLSSQKHNDGYRKQRERNNLAAKQSRDRRKLREVRLALQVTFLKKKLAELRTADSDRRCSRCRSHCLCWSRHESSIYSSLTATLWIIWCCVYI